MKPRGRHRDKVLTHVRINSLSNPGKYADGNGLYLVISSTGAKRWILRTVIQGKRCDIGLGGFNTVTLAEARESALAMRKAARAGGNPLAEKHAHRISTPTFKEAAYTVHAEHSASWKNAKHGNQWINTLTQYVFPFFGDQPVNQINTPDVLGVLSPIWLTKPETARRVKQRIGSVLDWAKASGFRSGDNPVEGVTMGLPRQASQDNHHSAIPYSEVPAFIQALHQDSGMESVHLAFEFMILTATRTSEVLNAKWSEVNQATATWTIPAERMKAGKEHRVPLSSRCLEILARAQAISLGGDYIFQGIYAEKPLSNMVFLTTLKRMGVANITAHGFRSSFRDWASEETHFSREVCEMALAHTVSNRVEAAYRRGDLFERRRALMNAWADYIA